MEMEQGSGDSKDRKRIYDEIVKRPERKIKAIIGFNVLAFFLYAPFMLLYGGARGGANAFILMVGHIFLCLILSIRQALTSNIWNAVASLLSVAIITSMGCGGCMIFYH